MGILLQDKAFPGPRYEYRKREITQSWGKRPIRPKGKPAMFAGCFVVNARKAPALLALDFARRQVGGLA
jgi:hypothetical protein